MKRAVNILLRILVFLLVTVICLVGIGYLSLSKIKNGPSESAKNLFVSTIMESGQLKFVASLICTPEEIDEIVNANGMEDMTEDVNTSLIVIKKDEPETESVSEDPDSTEDVTEEQAPTEPEVIEEFDENGIRLEEISGRTFKAKMLIIKDPSQVVVGSTYPWGEYGKELDQLVADCGGVAGVNGGIYVSSGNKGGCPMGVVVQGGVVTYNSPWDVNGTHMIGFNNDNILIIKNIDGMSKTDFEYYVQTEGIRDAVAFQDEASDADNHFVSLIINGVARTLDGAGSGANPRTVIGQRADGAVLLLVTDGRGTAGHLGATASDLIGIMQQYGAVNAANVDGGSSSTMVYNGNWEMTSVTFYYQNASWKLPTAFVVKPKAN